MARNLSRRRVLTHNDFMRFGGVEPKKLARPVRSGRVRPAARAPSQAQIRREVDAVIGTRCGCSTNALEADSNKFACPCGSHCTDAACVAENKRRSGIRKRHHESKPSWGSSQPTKPKRWVHKDVARANDVPEAVVRRIYKSVQTAKKQGLHGGHATDLLERDVGRHLIGGEYEVARKARDHLDYHPPGGYQGPKPTGAAAEPPRASSCDRRMREASQIRNAAERVIKDVQQRSGRAGTSEPECLKRLRKAADELDVAADLYEEAGARVLAGTVHERARQARSGEYRKLTIYHLRKR